MPRLTALERDLLAWTIAKLRYAELALGPNERRDDRERTIRHRVAVQAEVALIQRGNKLLLATKRKAATEVAR